MNVQEASLHCRRSAATSLLEQGPSFIERTAAVASAAAADADEVDRDARFPQSRYRYRARAKAARRQIPVEFGGFGASIYDVTDICYTLGRACASTAMIFAMHQTKVACVVRHGRGSPYQETLMRRVARDQLLLASSTTEGQNGGNIRSSAAAVDTQRHRDLARFATPP